MGDYAYMEDSSAVAGGRGARACMREQLFCIRGWAAWTPGRETEEAWRDWANGRTAAPDDPSARPPLPTLLRRRVSPLGQAALRAAWSLPDTLTSRIILASRHGEFGRTLSILDSLAAEGEVSPADFTLSVHHALVGLLSIAATNRHGHTAIAAGSESLGLGFVEALACLDESPCEPVTLLYYDEGLPSPFNDFDEAVGHAPLALALTLAKTGPSGMLGFTPISQPSDTMDRSIQALEFLRFLLAEQAELSWCGERFRWQWRRYAAAA